MTGTVLHAGMRTAAADAVPPPPAARRLGAVGTARACAIEAARDGRTLLRRMRRTPHVSAAEYEARWAQQSEEARWRSAASLEEALQLSSYGSADLDALMEFRAYRVAAPAFFGWRAKKLCRLFERRWARDAHIVEMGCGLGKNLLVLAAAGYRHLSGVDPTSSGPSAVRQQAEHFGVGIEALQGDMLRPRGAVRELLRDSHVFTNHVLEQVPRNVDEAVDALISAHPSEVLHLEPCAELLDRRNPVDLGTLLHIVASDYQRTLLQVLCARQAQGRIEVLEAVQLGYSPHLTHAPALLRWRVLP